MKKNPIYLLTTFTIATPIVALISCSNNNASIIEASNFVIDHDYSFQTSSDWNWFYNEYLNDKAEYVEEENKKVLEFGTRNFDITTLVAKNINNEKHFSEILTNKENGSQAISYVSLFPKNTNSEIVTSKSGITNPAKMTEHINANNYNFLANFQSFALNEGGLLNFDLLIKDGVIYNIPIMGTEKSGLRLKINSDFAIARTNDNNFKYIRNIPTIDDSLIKLHINTNTNDIIAQEAKGVDFFDIRKDSGVDINHLVNENGVDDPNGQYYHVDYQGPIGHMKDGDVRVVTEYHKDQKKEMDLTDSSLHAYLVEATELNGITTIPNRIFSDVKEIIQAPFKGKIIEDIKAANANKYDLQNFVVPTGKALIVTKGNNYTFNINQELSVDYKFDESNPLSQEFKDIKWATTSKDFLGNRWTYKGVTEPGDIDMIGQWVSSASWVLRSGKMPYLIDFVAANLGVNYSYFVEMANGDYGIASFTKSQYNPTGIKMSGNQLIQYLRSLGVMNAVALDGGGSVHQFVRENQDNWTPFPASADAGGYRLLPSALAIGGINE